MAQASVYDRWKNKDGTRSQQYGKGSRWGVRWREVKGGKVSQPSRSFRLKSDAEAFQASIEHSMRAGTYRSPKLAERLFADVAAEWLAAQGTQVESSLIAYESNLNTHVLPVWRDRAIGSIEYGECATWLASLLKGTASTTKRPLSSTYARGVYTRFACVLDWAVRNGYIPSNPARDVRKPKQPRGKRGRLYLTHEQVSDLADEMGRAGGDSQMRLLVLVLAYTGVRINEALALRAEDVDIAARVLHVNRTWTKTRSTGKRMKLGDVKGKQSRDVALPTFLAHELREHVAELSTGAWLFNVDGAQLDDGRVRRVWKIARRVLLPAKPVPHDLRHAAASLAIAEGADVKVVQNMLGHASAALTLDTYAELWPNRLHEVADALDTARRRALKSRHVRDVCADDEQTPTASERPSSSQRRSSALTA